MSTPTPKVAPYMSEKRSVPAHAQFSASQTTGRQGSWDSVHALSDSMQKMSVRSPPTPVHSNKNAKSRHRSQSDSSSDSPQIVTPVPSKDVESANAGKTQEAIDPHKSQSPSQGPTSQYSQYYNSPAQTQAGNHVPPGYQYRGPNAPVTIGKPDEILQVDYNLQPRHFISGSLTTSSNGPATAPRANTGLGFTPLQNGTTPGALGAQGFYGQPLAPSSNPTATNAAADNDIARQIAINNALQGLAPSGIPAGGLNPAAYANNPMLPGLYQQSIYGGTGTSTTAPPFYPGVGGPGGPTGQDGMVAAVANAVASLPPAAFHAALQHAGLAAYPIGAMNGVVGLNGMGAGVGMNPMGMAAQSVGGPSANNRKLGLYKTELCRSWEEKGTCRYGPKCQFAHGEDEVKRVQRHPKYKTEICRTFWLSGSCPYGKRCCFIHTELPAANGAMPGEEKERPEKEAKEQTGNPNSDTEQQQTSMLTRIKRAEATDRSTEGSSPPNAVAHPQAISPGTRPTPAALRVDTSSLEQTVPKNSYPYTSNPAMPAPGLSLATGMRVGRLSPVPATAGADFGMHAAARLEVVGISPQTTQASVGQGQRIGHLRSVSQTFPSTTNSAIESTSRANESTLGNGHLRNDSWGANAIIAPASAIDPPLRYNERKWA